MRPFSLVYNTDMFTAAGITTTPTTWDEFVADATKLTNSATGVYGTAVDYSDSFSPWKYIFAMTEQAGGNFVSSDLKTAGPELASRPSTPPPATSICSPSTT